MKQITARDIMTHHVLEAKADWSVRRLVEFFSEKSISGAPVASEGGKIIGVVSLTDILRHDSLPEKYSEPSGAHEYYLDTLHRQFTPQEIDSLQLSVEPLTTVREIMTHKNYSISEETTAQEIADSMLKNRIHRMFVTRGERVVGIVSAVDMLKVVRDM